MNKTPLFKNLRYVAKELENKKISPTELILIHYIFSLYKEIHLHLTLYVGFVKPTYQFKLNFFSQENDI